MFWCISLQLINTTCFVGRRTSKMAFSLLSSASLTFSTSGMAKSQTMTYKVARAVVEKLEKASAPDAGPGEAAAFERHLTKLENLLLAQSSEPGKRKRLNHHPLNCQLQVEIFYGALSPLYPSRTETGYVKILDKEDSKGLLIRLGRVCGGYENMKADMELDFGVKDDRMKLSFQDLLCKMLTQEKEVSFGEFFDLTPNLAEKWTSGTKFTGSITVTLKLNDEALNQIHLASLSVGESVNRKMLEKAGTTGDLVIIAANGARVKCHKIFLTAQNDVFEAMFKTGMKEAEFNEMELSDMTEPGVRGLLEYLYCRDIQKALSCSDTAAELLVAADKYGIDSLFDTMKDAILLKDRQWFNVAAALKLASFGKTKADDLVLKEIEKKALSVLRSKSVDELKECAEFREQFSNPDSGIEICYYLMQNK